jgi:molecular chaperone GrpE (heat shock protein)
MPAVRKAADPPTVPSDEFATAMQQLSAAAAHALPSDPLQKQGTGEQSGPDHITAGLQSLNERFDGFETAISRKLDQLKAAIAAAGKSNDLAAQFSRIEEQLKEIHGSETVNHRLFDSLHSELLAYRDNFLHESLQKPFIHDLVLLFDDLTSLSDQLKNAAVHDAHGNVTQWRDNLENAVHSLVEILHRFEVQEIEPKDMVDRAIHRVVSYEPADYAEEDGRIIMRVRRGFFWRGKLIRPEEVIAKRFG